MVRMMELWDKLKPKTCTISFIDCWTDYFQSLKGYDWRLYDAQKGEIVEL